MYMYGYDCEPRASRHNVLAGQARRLRRLVTCDGTSVAAGPDDDTRNIVHNDTVLEGAVRRQPTDHR